MHPHSPGSVVERKRITQRCSPDAVTNSSQPTAGYFI